MCRLICYDCNGVEYLHHVACGLVVGKMQGALPGYQMVEKSVLCRIAGVWGVLQSVTSHCAGCVASLYHVLKGVGCQCIGVMGFSVCCCIL